MKISKIITYDEPTVPEIRIRELHEFLSCLFPVTVETRGSFFKLLNKKTYEKIAATRIFNLKKPFGTHRPSSIEVAMEEENIDTSEKDEKALYDGYELLNALAEAIPAEECTIETLHIIFTNKITCTFDEDDFRYHARALIGSNPTIISTTGMIEAPAKSKQYYLDLMTNFSSKRIEETNRKHRGEFLEYHDSRMSEISKGYLLQAVTYYETGEAFCKHSGCRLFNAHWQKDLFHSQLENKGFCKKHSEMLRGFEN